MLEANFGAVPKEMFERITKLKEGSNPGVYPDELKSFAMTLQFYLTKAYEYVRETFEMALPHPSQSRSWYAAIDGDPGFTKSAFAALRRAVHSSHQFFGEVTNQVTNFKSPIFLFQVTKMCYIIQLR